MTKEEKTTIIDELKSKMTEKVFFYLINAGGMSVEKTNNFRRLCFEKNIEYKVYKNTLIKKAMESVGIDYKPFEGTVLKGFSGVLFSSESGNAPARLLKEFKDKGNEKPEFKGASIDSALFVGVDNLDALTKIKSRLEMIAELVGLLQSPGKRLASALQSSGNKLAGVLKALEERANQEA